MTTYVKIKMVEIKNIEEHNFIREKIMTKNNHRHHYVEYCYFCKDCGLRLTEKEYLNRKN